MLERARWVGLAAAVIAGVAIFACKSSGGFDDGGAPSFQSVCATGCPHACTTDNDCHQQGQLCCDYGGGAKACVAPASCPTFCADDSKCNSVGQACCAANRASTQKVCVGATTCPHTCASDTDCPNSTQRCCTDFTQTFCATAASSDCPAQCANDTQCQTASGEVCCLSAALKSLGAKALPLADGVKGLCLPSAACPHTCTASTDCNTSAGELCCNGSCQTKCEKNCGGDNDCETEKGEVCCTNSVIASPWFNWKATPPTDGGLDAATDSGPEAGGDGGCGAGACSTHTDCSGASDTCCAIQSPQCAGCKGQCMTSQQCSQAGGAQCP